MPAAEGIGTMAESDNPDLPGSLRIFSGAVILVLLVGAGLFFVPDMVKPRWPWPLAPFNARFLGSFYLAEMVAMVALLVWNRWSPARMILVMAFVFTLVVTATSLVNLDHFNFGRKASWLWFAVYAGSAIVAGLFLWNARGTPPVAAAMSGAGWRRYFQLEAVLLGLYGLGLLICRRPSARSGHGRSTPFHAQTYSAIFITAATGTWLISSHAPREELVALGAAQLALGAACDHRPCRHRRRGQAGRLGSAGNVAVAGAVRADRRDRARQAARRIAASGGGLRSGVAGWRSAFSAGRCG